MFSSWNQTRWPKQNKEIHRDSKNVSSILSSVSPTPASLGTGWKGLIVCIMLRVQLRLNKAEETRRNSKEKIYIGKDCRGQTQSFFSLLSDDNSDVPWVSLRLQTSGTYSRCRCWAKLTWVLESNVLKGNWSRRHIRTPWPAIRPNQESKHTWWNVMVSFSMLTTWFMLPPCLTYRESRLA